MPRMIRASEVGSHLYCRRAWWYRKQGVESQNQAELAAGTAIHAQHGSKLMLAGLMQILGYVLLLVAIVVLVYELTGLLLR
jgi:hypothetical protein